MAARIMAPAGCPSCWARSARGVHGSLDLGDLLDGDVRPAVDPRVLYTAALDWLGADVEAVLGRRYDDGTLLRA